MKNEETEKIVQNVKIDEMVLLNEKPIITLNMFEGYSDRVDKVEIFINDIKHALVGDEWFTSPVHSTRDAKEMSAKIIYKDAEGASVLITTHRWNDKEEPEIQITRKLVWIAFGTSYPG
ncbi:MAG: hypothetical protein QXZ12_06870 [Thermoplasmata archaeon]